MSDRNKLDTVFYPYVGMNHITRELAHLFEYKMDGKESIKLYLCAQLNSYPHVGTLINFMCAFAIGDYLHKYFDKPVSITVDLLTNNPGETLLVDGIKYFRSLNDTIIDGVKATERYKCYFEEMLKKIASLSETTYTIRLYDEFQRQPIVRRTVVEVLKKKDIFERILSPSDKQLHLRFPCPQCKYTEKYSDNLNIDFVDENIVQLKNKCFEHGDISISISENNDDYFDMNVPFRNFVRGVSFIETDKKEKSLSILVDGNDWAGIWSLRIYSEGLLVLGYRELVNMLFTPAIVDWAGTKLSKRMYVGNKAYREMNKQGLINITLLESDYGEDAYLKLWTEINSWISDTRKFFRDYSVEYLDLILS